MNFLLIFFASFFSIIQGIHADCLSPAGVAGQMQWYSAELKFKYCDGTSWKETNRDVVGSCSGTTSGTINYLSSNLRFCDGTNWYNMNSSTTLGACAGTTTGTFIWDSSLLKMKFCDGANWKDLTLPSTCNLPWGGTIANGASVTAYQNSAPVGTNCVGESRTCTNGVLTGSYTSQACNNGCTSITIPAMLGDRQCTIANSSHGNGKVGTCSAAPNGGCTADCNNGTWTNQYNDCQSD